MAFNLDKIVRRKFSSPQEMFRENKKKSVTGVLDYQSKMIDSYLRNIDSPDIALELPTGSGKTLIGLLIAEFRRNNNKELVVYLCPTRQLAKQVHDQAINQYGLDPVLLIGPQGEFPPDDISRFKTAKAIAISTYSAIFNTNSFFKDADVLIFDDAHSAENYIARYWSLEIDRSRHSLLYSQIIELYKDSFAEQVYQKLSDPEHTIYDLFWFDKLPYPDFLNKLKDLSGILANSCPDFEDLKFNWIAIENILNSCYVYLSSAKILIRPIIPPSKNHLPFRTPKQRLYMSATLGLSGELERITGVSKIVRLPLLDEWKKQTIGRRFFMFPELKFNEVEVEKHLMSILSVVDRTLILAPSDPIADELQAKIKKHGIEVVGKKQFEESKKAFTEKKNVVAILANRFDGIDLPHNECRLLVIYNLPKATNLQEKFLIAKMCASVLFHERIRTRITQAIGRCTRGANDYSAVYILGNDLRDELLVPKKQQYYHPEIQAELIFGQQESDKNDISELTDNFKSFLNFTGEDWQKAESVIYELRDSSEVKEDANFNALMSSAPHEVNFMYHLLSKNYDKAINEAEKALSFLNGDDLQGYRSFWYYNLGCVAFSAVKDGHKEYATVYKKYFKLAAESSNAIDWLTRLYKYDESNAPGKQPNETHTAGQVERIEGVLLKIGLTSVKKFESKINSVLASISSLDSPTLENGHRDLGELLGFISEKSSDSSAPDPWWVSDRECLVSEIKVKDVLGATDIKQASKHPDWLRRKTVHSGCIFTSFVLTNSKMAEDDSLIFADNVFYWNVDDYKNFAIQYFDVLRQLKNNLREEGDIAWREFAAKLLHDSGFDFLSIKKQLLTRKLVDSVTIPSKTKR